MWFLCASSLASTNLRASGEPEQLFGGLAHALAKKKKRKCMGENVMQCSALNECCEGLVCLPYAQFGKMICNAQGDSEYPMGREPKLKVVITSHPRSGSTFLQNMFQSEPDVSSQPLLRDIVSCWVNM